MLKPEFIEILKKFISIYDARNFECCLPAIYKQYSLDCSSYYNLEKELDLNLKDYNETKQLGKIIYSMC